MLQSFRNIFLVPDLKKRVLYTLGILLAYRIGSFIPTPGIDPLALESQMGGSGGVLGFLNLFTGGALRRYSIFALGVMPYISASIILQLLTVVVPYLEKLSKEGEAGRRKITQYTRYLTAAVCIVQGLGIAFYMESREGVVLHPGTAFRLMSLLTLTTGTLFLMWLGERITERGIGNGMSIIIFAGIIVDIPAALFQSFHTFQNDPTWFFKIIAISAIMIAAIAFVIFVERAQRRIPIQYARRIVGRRMTSGQTTHMPLRLNTGGVIPIIFAQSVLTLPQVLPSVFSKMQGIPGIAAFFAAIAPGTPMNTLMYAVIIIFFSYFYVSIVFNPVDVADNIKKQGGFIPGKRPGARTAEYIDRILSRITLGGSFYLIAVATLPTLLTSGLQLDKFPLLGGVFGRFLPDFVNQGLGVPFYFGGTSLLIVVGVAMDTMQQIESQMIMRHYEGFLKGSRLRGRRG